MPESSNTKLSAVQRVAVAGIEVVAFFILCLSLSGSFDFLFETSSPFNLLFLSGALMVILGKYVAEPFFTTPMGSICNTTAAFLALLSVNSPEHFVLYYPFLVFYVIVFICSILTLVLSSFEKAPRLKIIMLKIATTLGSSKVLFSIIYILGAISYFHDSSLLLTIMVAAWVIVVNTSFFEKVVKVFSSVKKSTEILKIGEVQSSIADKHYVIGFSGLERQDIPRSPVVVIPVGQDFYRCCLIGKINYHASQVLLSAYSTTDYLFGSTPPLLKHTKIIGEPTNPAILVDIKDIPERTRASITESKQYLRQEKYIGLVDTGSDIDTISIRLEIAEDSVLYDKVYEGAVLRTAIHGEDVLFQVINGTTRDFTVLPTLKNGSVLITARKLGTYSNEKHQLKPVRWLPDVETPVWLFDSERTEISTERCIGVLPETSCMIPMKNLNELITHNTAILGILGVGKSCLTFELIQKIVKSEDTSSAKILCIDITNEYKEALSEYGVSAIKVTDASLTEDLSNNYRKPMLSKDEGGNIGVFREGFKKLLSEFMTDEKKRVGVVNPEDFLVSKQVSNGKSSNYGKPPFDLTPFADLTPSEITRIIAEESLEYCRTNTRLGSTEANLLLVFEEAHTLIPEWSSAANDGDRNASNGIARVILQGRKYGLGSFVVAQRTANVSKSVLNQCNTIFALRVFDDTGKHFLENYVGSDYANMLSSLEERHAVVSGKALDLSCPVIVKLNDKKAIIKQPKEDNGL